jgi:hypothetical protein
MFSYTHSFNEATSDGRMREAIVEVLGKLSDPQTFSAHFPDGKIERLTTYESAIALISANPAVVVHVD